LGSRTIKPTADRNWLAGQLRSLEEIFQDLADGVLDGAVTGWPLKALGLVQQGIEPLVERVARGLSQLVGRDEQGLLPRLPLAHRHRRPPPGSRPTATARIPCPLSETV
jgi:hypothetical protein